MTPVPDDDTADLPVTVDVPTFALRPLPWASESGYVTDANGAIIGAVLASLNSAHPCDRAAVLRLWAAAPTVLAALEAADEFITNGIEFGFIRMPDPETNDPASKTPGIVREALGRDQPIYPAKGLPCSPTT